MRQASLAVLQCDALVVGAGPAGASVALRLARAGIDTVMLERARMPRTKVCGEYLSPATLESLEDLGVLSAVRSQAHGLRTLRLAGFGLGPIAMQLPCRGGLGIARSRFDTLLADAAVAAGARLINGTFVNVSRSERGVDVAYRDAEGASRSVRTLALVGADGAWSAVAQRCAMSGKERVGGRWAVGGHLQIPSDGDEIEMYVGPEGYYARNPLGDGLTNAMLVMPRPIPEIEADAVVQRLSDGVRRFEPELLVRRVAVGPLRYRARCAMEGSVVLAGDAAELVDPFLGQGLALAVGLSGAAAEAAQQLVAGRPAREIARHYAAARAAAVRPIRFNARAIDALLRTPWLRRRAVRTLERRPELADALLAAVAGAAPGGTRLSPLVMGLLA